MEKKHLFNEIAEQYDKHRARYSEALFEDIFDYSGVNSNSDVLEIGCGTGIATKPFIRKKCRLEAIEIGKNLAEYTIRKYSDYAKFAVRTTSFKDFQSDKEGYDLIYSATAFHWIPKKIGYKKSYDLLKKEGAIALFWNRPTISDSNMDLKDEIQLLYKKHLGELDSQRVSQSKEEMYLQVDLELERYGFEDIRTKNLSKQSSLDWRRICRLSMHIFRPYGIE